MSTKPDLTHLLCNEPLWAKDLSGAQLEAYLRRRCLAVSSLKVMDIRACFDDETLDRLAYKMAPLMHERDLVVDTDPAEIIRAYLISAEMDEAVFAQSRLFVASLRVALAQLGSDLRPR
jgi:hypothetical protein